jgi:mono/diheme cytochrome c family protein
MCSRFGLRFLSLAFITCPITFGAEPYSFEKAQGFLKQYCQSCHSAKGAGGFNLQRVGTTESLRTEPQKWASLSTRVRNAEMPPKGSPSPDLDEREIFTEWLEKALRAEACATGITPGPSPIRRLNRDEYSATIRDLLDIHMDLGRALPADAAGGEGFDNAAETLFLSPLHSEKYLETAKLVLDFAARDSKARAKIFAASPQAGISEEQAARRSLQVLLPRAFRRPIEEADVLPYLGLFQAARKRGEAFDGAMLFAVRGILVSPHFLFRAEPPNASLEPRPLNDYALASRLSYFLWGSMPDELLFDIAELGKLHEPSVLKEQVARLLRHPKSINFAERFVEQWLRTRDLGGEKSPDAKLFPMYARDEDLRSDIRYEPVLFFRELLVKKLSLLNLLDSKFTIGTRKLSNHYGFKIEGANQQPKRMEFPEGTRRGGLLGMASVLAVSSHPYRTSPVLRGAWILDSILGTPPPPPPPNVPALEEDHKDAAPKSLRERLTQHRANPVCASCHSRIDPLGFALDNYDVLGRWRTEDGGRPVDTTGEMPDGTKIDSPERLKAVLLERKDLFVRNLAGKLLGYALGRGLALKDSCTVDSIVEQVKESGYDARTLVEAIVLSMPFRYQAGVAPAAAPVRRSAGAPPPTVGPIAEVINKEQNKR